MLETVFSQMTNWQINISHMSHSFCCAGKVPTATQGRKSSCEEFHFQSKLGVVKNGLLISSHAKAPQVLNVNSCWGENRHLSEMWHSKCLTLQLASSLNRLCTQMSPWQSVSRGSWTSLVVEAWWIQPGLAFGGKLFVFAHCGQKLPETSEKICKGSVSAWAYKILCHEPTPFEMQIACLHTKGTSIPNSPEEDGSRFQEVHIAVITRLPVELCDINNLLFKKTPQDWGEFT